MPGGGGGGGGGAVNCKKDCRCCGHHSVCLVLCMTTARRRPGGQARPPCHLPSSLRPAPAQRCAHTCRSPLQSYATLANSDSEEEGVGIVASAKRWLAGASRKGSALMPR